MPDPFEILDHTADIGIRAFGPNLPGLFENAARGTLHLIADPESVRPASEEILEVRGSDAVDLLVAWLHEIIFRCDAHHRLFADVRVDHFSRWCLRATLRGEPLDLARHRVRAEIKGVTYHAARVQETAHGWVAEILFDV